MMASKDMKCERKEEKTQTIVESFLGVGGETSWDNHFIFQYNNYIFGYESIFVTTEKLNLGCMLLYSQKLEQISNIQIILYLGIDYGRDFSKKTKM